MRYEVFWLFGTIAVYFGNLVFLGHHPECVAHENRASHVRRDFAVGLGMDFYNSYQLGAHLAILPYKVFL